MTPVIEDGRVASRSYEMSFRDLVHMFYRRRRFIVRVALLGIVLGGLISFAMRPVYTASSEITADRIPPVILLDQPGLGAQSVASPLALTPPDVPTLVAFAQSERVRTQAINTLRAARRWAAAAAVARGLRVAQYRNTQFVQITVAARNPAVAAEAANAVTTSLINNDLISRRRWAQDMRQSIQEQLVIVNPKLRSAEEKLTAFKAQYGAAPLSAKTDAALNRLAQLEAQREEVRLQEQEARARIQAAQSSLAQQGQMAPTVWRPSPLISTLQTQLASEQIELSGLRRLFTTQHPQVIEVSAKIAETKRKLDTELSRSLEADQYGINPVYQQLAQQLRQDEISSAAAAARDQALGAAIADYEDTVRELPERELAEARLARDVKEAEAIHQVLTEKLQQALAAEASIGSVIRVVDVAQPPVKPAKPRPLALLIGTILGLAFGFGGALIMEQVENPLKSVGHGEWVLGTRVLGVIPGTPPWDPRARILPQLPDDPRLRRLVEKQRARLAPRIPRSGPWRYIALWPAPGTGRRHQRAERWRSAFGESFRALRTNLVGLTKEPLRALLVTSVRDDEGKDIVAANLAIALAQSGLRVWLVDCDLRKPALDRASVFHPSGEATGGIVDVLTGGVAERALLQETMVKNLWFLPAGAAAENPAELLGSDRMRQFLGQPREDIDTMVLVAPPLLPVTDAATLATAVDGVLLCVQIGATPQDSAVRARQQLEALGARVLGAVFTDASAEGLGDYFKYAGRDYRAHPAGIWYFGPEKPLTQGAPRA